MTRTCARIGLFLAFAAAASPVPSEPAVEYTQAVEFPYYLCPQTLWERELVWLKNLGIHTIEFSVPWNWHQLPEGGFDLTGRTSPRRDLVGFVRLLRRLGLRAWVRPLPPVAGWPNGGAPAGAADAGAQRAWLKALESVLTTQTASHGGPVAWVEGGVLSIDAAKPPTPVVVIPADDPNALGRSRAAIAGTRGALLWTGLEESLYPAGWEANAGPLLHKGAVDIGGTDRRGAAVLSRDAALLRNWSPLLAGFQPVAMPKPAAGKLPNGVTAVELASPAASAVSISNQSAQPFHDELRAVEAVSKHVVSIPNVTVGPGESLWLPLNVSLGPKGLCRECSNFSAVERIVYATAELLSIEYENGILAMEFSAPTDAEAILQLERQPVGPYLAAGKPTDFDWDDKLFRARLPIPASRAADHRVRVGIAMEAPETSAFFNDARRLIVGRKNMVSTSYSSPELAARSRLRLPDGYTATSKPGPEGVDRLRDLRARRCRAWRLRQPGAGGRRHAAWPGPPGTVSPRHHSHRPGHPDAFRTARRTRTRSARGHHRSARRQQPGCDHPQQLARAFRLSAWKPPARVWISSPPNRKSPSVPPMSGATCCGCSPPRASADCATGI